MTLMITVVSILIIIIIEITDYNQNNNNDDIMCGNDGNDKDNPYKINVSALMFNTHTHTCIYS